MKAIKIIASSLITILSCSNDNVMNEHPFSGTWESPDLELRIEINNFQFLSTNQKLPYFWSSYFDTIPGYLTKYHADYSLFAGDQDAPMAHMEGLDSGKILKVDEEYYLVFGDTKKEDIYLITSIRQENPDELQLRILYCEWNGSLENSTFTLSAQK